jgi:putative NADPH-quinone reductase
MKITVIQGHPDGAGGHLCHALADAYCAGARSAGHEVRVIDVGKIEFPLLRTKEAFESGPVPGELQSAQQDLGWADHLLLVYPLWLGEMPAIVKGFFEQVLRPGFAYDLGGTKGWTGRLHGKTARVVVTMGMPATVYRWYFGSHSLKSLRRNILSFVGIRPVHATLLGLVETASAKRKAAWLANLEQLGSAAR